MALFGDSSVISSNNSGASSNNRQFQSLLDANPYRNITYQKSPWQNFLSALGFRTQADAWKENMDIQAREYDAAILQKQYDEEYNDPQSQVDRMRSAGLNPDIDGGSSIDPGSAAPMGEDPSTPMQTTGEESLPLQFANGVFSAFSTAVGLIQSVQGIQSKHLQNIMQSISNESAFSDFTNQIWPAFLPDSPDPVAGDGVSLMSNDFDWQSVALSNAEKFAGKLPRKMRDKFVSQVSQYWQSGPGQAKSYDEWKNRVKNRRDFYSERGTFYSDIDSVLDDIVGPLNEMSEKIFKSSQSRQLAENESAQIQAEYNSEVTSQLDASADAAAQNAGFAAESAQANLNKTNADTVQILNGTIESIVKNLEKSRHDGGIKGGLSSVALALIAGVRLWLAYMGAPSVSRSQSSGTGFGPGIYSNQSRGFSIGF